MIKNSEIIIKVRAVILHEGRLLVVRHKQNVDFMALPGGHLERNEGIKECLEREITEELGIKPKIGRPLYVNTFTDNEKQYVEFFFEVINGSEYLNPEKNIRSHAFEINQVAWISPSDDIALRPKSFAKDFKENKVISDEIRYIKD